MVEALECCGSHPHPHHDDDGEEVLRSALKKRQPTKPTYAVYTRPDHIKNALVAPYGALDGLL